jgi:hypothetical protein
MDTEAMRSNVSDAIRFWEPMRVAYNVVLAAIVLFYFVRGFPASKQAATFDEFLLLLLLAVLANVAYCSVYLVDVFVQFSAYRDFWRKNRWILFLIGLLFAAILTRFWAMAFFATAKG